MSVVYGEAILFARTHVLTFKGGTRWRCLCGRGFTRAKTARRHERRAHPDGDLAAMLRDRDALRGGARPA